MVNSSRAFLAGIIRGIAEHIEKSDIAVSFLEVGGEENEKFNGKKCFVLTISDNEEVKVPRGIVHVIRSWLSGCYSEQ